MSQPSSGESGDAKALDIEPLGAGCAEWISGDRHGEFQLIMGVPSNRWRAFHGKSQRKWMRTGGTLRLVGNQLP